MGYYNHCIVRVFLCGLVPAMNDTWNYLPRQIAGFIHRKLPLSTPPPKSSATIEQCIDVRVPSSKRYYPAAATNDKVPL